MTTTTKIKQTPPKPPTPLEILLGEKRRLKELSTWQEEELAADFDYIQDNAGSLLMSGVSALIFPKNKTSKDKDTEIVGIAESKSSLPFGFSDALAIVGGLLPTAWDIARPIVFAWGIRQAKKWISKKFLKKKTRHNT